MRLSCLARAQVGGVRRFARTERRANFSRSAEVLAGLALEVLAGLALTEQQFCALCLARDTALDHASAAKMGSLGRRGGCVGRSAFCARAER